MSILFDYEQDYKNLKHIKIENIKPGMKILFTFDDHLELFGEVKTINNGIIESTHGTILAKLKDPYLKETYIVEGTTPLYRRGLSQIDPLKIKEADYVSLNFDNTDDWIGGLVAAKETKNSNISYLTKSGREMFDYHLTRQASESTLGDYNTIKM